MIQNRSYKNKTGIHRGIYIEKNLYEHIKYLSKEHSISGNEIIRQTIVLGINSKEFKKNLSCLNKKVTLNILKTNQ